MSTPAPAAPATTTAAERARDFAAAACMHAACGDLTAADDSLSAARAARREMERVDADGGPDWEAVGEAIEEAAGQVREAADEAPQEDDAAARIGQVRAAYEAAEGRWTGADWTHERQSPCSSAEHGHYHPCPACSARGTDLEIEGDPAYCEGGDSQYCQTCADAEGDASAAEEAAEAAMVAAEAGDWAEAARLAREAADLECAYGDDPVWGPFAAAVTVAAEAAAAE